MRKKVAVILSLAMSVMTLAGCGGKYRGGQNNRHRSTADEETGTD